ncbi:MAG: SDR family oxidoreductase [Bacteroidia bacterium]|nr:SDR family oxidoreductase [Bacteroidia bacterium]
MEKEKIYNSRVLVTGGAGFIGSNIVEALLSQNNEVICLDNFITGKRENIEEFLQHKNFRLIEGDIRDMDVCKKAVDGTDYILHQAALGSVPRSINDPKTTNDVNVGGFVNILVAAKDAKVKRFVYASSSSVYGDSPDLPKVEEKIGNPLSPYAISKLANEMYAKNFSEIYGIETIGLRYFNVFGKKQDPNGPYAAVIPKFIKALLNGDSPIIFGDGTQSRDFTYIDNVVQVNQLAAVTDNIKALNTVYNVAYGKSISLNQLFDMLKSTISTHIHDVLTAQPVYSAERKGDIKHSLASIAKAINILGFNPEIQVSKGIELLIKNNYTKTIK